MSVRSRLSFLVLALAGVPLLAGCQSAEIERLQSELASSQAASTAQADEAEQMRTELRTQVDALAAERAELVAELDANAAARAELKSELKASEKIAEDLEDDKHELESHRDELVEWVNELLPLAEKQDPRLQKLRDVTDDIAKQVEEYRGLKFKRPFMRRLINREEVKKFMRRDMERDMPKEEMDKMVRVMSEFGLLRRESDLMELFEGFMEAGAAAFYKPNTGTFYLIEGKNDRGDRPIVFHELIHALEDQHFDLTKMQTAFDSDSDGGMGIKGLIEGSAERMTNLYTAENPEDATAMMAAQMTPDMVQRQMKMMQEVPPFLIAAMGLYPYKNGAIYLDALDLDGSAALDEVFRNPPISTEQVLHPEKFGKDYPHSVAAPELEDALGDAWEVLDDDSMGELFCGLLLTTNRYDPQLKSNMPVFMGVMDMRTQGVGFKGKIKTAVEGWDGDRYTAAVEKDGQAVCVAWTSVWDSEDDAAEFGAYYASLLGMRVNGATKPVNVEPGPVRFTAEDGAVSGVEIQGRKVVVVLSAPAASADAVFAAGWAAETTPDARDEADMAAVSASEE